MRARSLTSVYCSVLFFFLKKDVNHEKRKSAHEIKTIYIYVRNRMHTTTTSCALSLSLVCLSLNSFLLCLYQRVCGCCCCLFFASSRESERARDTTRRRRYEIMREKNLLLNVCLSSFLSIYRSIGQAGSRSEREREEFTESEIDDEFNFFLFACCRRR
jgi:hypothetical protein